MIQRKTKGAIGEKEIQPNFTFARLLPPLLRPSNERKRHNDLLAKHINTVTTPITTGHLTTSFDNAHYFYICLIFLSPIDLLYSLRV
jgi:hypothetical protein